MPQLEAVIGLEVHAQMNTRSKMFCPCDNDAFGKAPNTTVCPVCMGHPGTLPAPNAEAIQKALVASLALNCTIQRENHFDRKHYFYPDLPAGFQISQYDFPLAKAGMVHFSVVDASGKAIGGERECRITRLHMENDAGKLTHHGNKTLCDFNRAGTPLMEIVTEPDLRSAQEAVAFAQELRRILIAVGASEADMFKGMMRFDASISLREKGTQKLNPRSEIKNLNSFKALEKALTYETKRLTKLWEESSGPLPNDITVGWMDEEEKTRLLRDKETAMDYRYFPEPDIPPLVFSEKEIAKTRSALPTLPQELRKQYAGLGLTDAQVLQLTDVPQLRALFDVVREKTGDSKRAVALVLTQLLGFLNAHGKALGDAPAPEALLELVTKIDEGTISANAGKDVLEKMVASGKNPSAIIEEEGMQQISDDTAIEELVAKAIEANPQAVESYTSGKGAALGAIVGWVMKETKGQADPKKVNDLLLKKLSQASSES
ncbi:Asp-tRNA(Asn)/Glu-tRNA(Gln) amidotransferase GatCAB subunit B [Candidatus Peregrinibacteria bacterium CG10_big_fil_rev_8_21_14_0_10_55_24]|nr:MAG: Asp-tRNA(Asn)/Glu-tRNA(Gln) amidotransferase GatCAB subunit B [Candidatus Peregrinibacteria bacterium CG10_big_fil_rev_8_21_14_0_10_55_24]